MNNPHHLLSVQHISKRYNTQLVVNDLSFAVKKGECYGLLGPNGAGKTTTIKLCLGLITADAGNIELNTHSMPKEGRRARMSVGVVPQIDSLDPDFTVIENLLVYGRYFGLDAEKVRARIPNLLEFARLENKRHAKIGELSGGMKRRLTMARALINDPDIIFMDEPTTGLDPQARHLIWERLKNLLAQGKTILLTTHFMDEAERLCSRLAVLDNGRKIAEGTPQALIAAHIEPKVVEIYGEGAAQWVQQHSAGAARVEQSGETYFCYTHDEQALLTQLQNNAGTQVRYLYRPANLEDVFLKLTGREMRD